MEVKLQPRRSTAKTKSRPMVRTAFESCARDGRKLLHHVFDDIADDGQFEFLVVVGLVHQENPDDQESEADDRRQEERQETDRDMHGRRDHSDDRTANPEDDPYRDERNIEGDRLRRVELYERPLVDEQEN